MKKGVRRGGWAACLIVAAGLGAALPHATPVSAATARVFTPSNLCPQVPTQPARRLHISDACPIVITVVAAPSRHEKPSPFLCPTLGVRSGIGPHGHAHAAGTHARQATTVCGVRMPDQGSAPERQSAAVGHVRHLEPVAPLIHRACPCLPGDGVAAAGSIAVLYCWK
jgi:hypothetical protein